jgi:fumarate reductase subunit C
MPKPYIRKMPATWWLRKRAYFWFMIRELTAVLMAVYCVILLLLLFSMKKQGGAAYDDFLALLQTAWSVGFHFIAFVAAMFHAVTWFALVPKALVIRMGEEKVPPFVLVGAHWLAWAVVSVLLVWLVFVLGPTL